MATIDLATLSGTTAPSRWSGGVRTPYMVEVTIDLAAAVTAKGSALAQADVIEAIDIPADTLILGGGIQMLTAMTGTSTDATIDVGVTGGNVDVLVDGFDLDGASANDYAVTGVQIGSLVTAADTIDVLIATQTGTITGGTFRVFAICLDVSAKDAPGIAALQS
jgi:hypothetical protein